MTSGPRTTTSPARFGGRGLPVSSMMAISTPVANPTVLGLRGRGGRDWRRPGGLPLLVGCLRQEEPIRGPVPAESGREAAGPTPRAARSPVLTAPHQLENQHIHPPEDEPGGDVYPTVPAHPAGAPA